MAALTLDLPAMYGDHHVQEVRRILLAQPGVVDVYASSCFRVVEIAYDEETLDPAVLKEELDAAGYLGELPAPQEDGEPPVKSNGQPAFYRRETAAAPNRPISFTQQAPYAGRPLWPCPGIGVLKSE